MSKRLPWLVLLSAAGMLVGCIIPTPPGPNPLKDRVDFIRAGQTDRAAVVAQLSAPDLMRRGERFFGYIAYQSVGGVLGLGGMGGAFGAIWLKAHFVGIEFDERNIVSRVDHAVVHTSASAYTLSPWRACLPTGVCIDFHKGGLVASAAAPEDQMAKRFQPVPDHCSIYLMRSDKVPKSMFPVLHFPRLFSIDLDDANKGESGPATYFHWIALPGQHRIKATPIARDLLYALEPTDQRPVSEADAKKEGNALQLGCRPSEVIYIHQDDAGHLQRISDQQGKANVLLAEKLLDKL